jgi:hypothetical protein
MKKDLAYWLDEVTVSSKGDHDREAVNWWPDALPWGVSTPTDGVAAVFMAERDAYRWRLDYINRKLNP